MDMMLVMSMDHSIEESQFLMVIDMSLVTQWNHSCWEWTDTSLPGKKGQVCKCFNHRPPAVCLLVGWEFTPSL